MNPTQRSLRDQVIVIIGATSGIGLATAEIAAERGAAVVLAAESQLDLAGVVARITQKGGRVAAVAAHVGNERHIAHVGVAAVREFGRIDTWVNSADLGPDGSLLEQPTREARRLFDLNFWSPVYGCRVAVEHMRAQGGTIVNIGRRVFDRAAPPVGIYSVSKHAVRSYTDALRAELRDAGSPVRVSFVESPPIEADRLPYGPINSNGEAGRRLAQPPQAVARAILRCAENPVREVRIGRVPRLLSLSTIAPPMVALGAAVAAGVAASRATERKPRNLQSAGQTR